jgi:hypothetical protein
LNWSNTMKNLNELQEHRAALVAELEPLTANVQKLEEALELARRARDALASPAGTTPEFKDARATARSVDDQHRDACKKAHVITGQIASIDLLVKADADSKQAAIDERAAADQVTRVAGSLRKVLERLDSLRTEIQQASEAAQQGEQAAAQAIAKATVRGDDKAEKAATAEMSAAIDAGRKAEEKHRTSQVIISAFEAEAKALGEQLEVAKVQALKARRVVLRGSQLKIESEWDAAAAALATIGARLKSVLHELDGTHGTTAFWVFSDLHIRSFTPAGRTIAADNLSSYAAGWVHE